MSKRRKWRDVFSNTVSSETMCYAKLYYLYDLSGIVIIPLATAESFVRAAA